VHQVDFSVHDCRFY